MTAIVAVTGVWNRGWVRPNAAGSTPSRPIANSVRAAAVAQATHTMNAAQHAADLHQRAGKAAHVRDRRWSSAATGSVPILAPLFTPKPIVIEYVVHR